MTDDARHMATGEQPPQQVGSGRARTEDRIHGASTLGPQSRNTVRLALLLVDRKAHTQPTRDLLSGRSLPHKPKPSGRTLDPSVA